MKTDAERRFVEALLKEATMMEHRAPSPEWRRALIDRCRSERSERWSFSLEVASNYFPRMALAGAMLAVTVALVPTTQGESDDILSELFSEPEVVIFNEEFSEVL